MNRMIRSSVLRNHYLDVVRQAGLGNAAATKKSLEKFDISARRLEEKSNKNNPNQKEMEK